MSAAKRPYHAREAVRLLLLLLTVCLPACRTASPIGLLRQPAEQVARHAQFEIAFRPEEPLDHAWLTDASALGARFTSPSGRTVRVAAFRTRDFESELREFQPERASVSGLKIYVDESQWPDSIWLTVFLDNVRLVNTETGGEKTLGDFEQGPAGWESVGCYAAPSDEVAVEGDRSLRMDMSLGEPQVWPGALLPVDGEDWSAYHELRFSAYLQANVRSGRIRAEYLTAAGQQVEAGAALRGELQPDQWTEIVWELTPPTLPEFSHEPVAVGEPYYAVRFMPREPGTHRYQILRDGKVVHRGRFRCVPSDLPAPMRISAADGAYFEREDGRPWLAVGENVCWYGRGRTFDYEQWLNRLAEAGGNYCRIWMPPWAFAVEWGGLGRYRLDRAHELDYVLKLARRLDIHVMLCLDYHGAFLRRGGTWPDNPYNATKGGPCARPLDFFRGEEATQLYRRRLRYLVARYASYGNLLAWEFFNE
ncbi:MAG: hypothetical protein KAX19_05235, partial [Candidatus Brocadiae bacterium]|nr:hypothetical protein [Candidatus Brocadiia bacterium]